MKSGRHFHKTQVYTPQIKDLDDQIVSLEYLFLSIEGEHVEIHGHLDGKVSGQDIVIGSTGTVKGDIEFGNNLKTENGADIDGYIKKTNKSKSTLTGDFLFKKKDKKEPTEAEDRPEVVNKEVLA